MEPEPWRLLDGKTWSQQELSATWLNAASYVNSCSAPVQAPILAQKYLITTDSDGFYGVQVVLIDENKFTIWYGTVKNICLEFSR